MDLGTRPTRVIPAKEMQEKCDHFFPKRPNNPPRFWGGGGSTGNTFRRDARLFF
jgi:hypothetical protein